MRRVRAGDPPRSIELQLHEGPAGVQADELRLGGVRPLPDIRVAVGRADVVQVGRWG